MSFEFATAARIIFGAGKRSELIPVAKGFGSRALLVTGGNARRSEWAREALTAAGFGLEDFSIPNEPPLALVERGSELARSAGLELVIAIGGGSVIDGAKAIAALATNQAPLLDYLEVIGAARPLGKNPLPLIALPTTAGTGAEVTRNAVLLSPSHQLKVSLRSAKMLPPVAIVDPELTYDLPPALSACTGMDALTQLIEPFLCNRANPLVDALCREAIPKVLRALPVACEQPRNKGAREDLALGSLFGGLALANAGLGAVHGFAAPIGGLFSAPHGAICAALLPGALEVNYRAIFQRAGGSEILRRFGELAALITGIDGAPVERAISEVHTLARKLNIPPLSAYGVNERHFPQLCQRAAQASSMKANPILLTDEELAAILRAAL